ncbi:isochorismatase family protein [Acidisoma cellulosilytica]|uniref:Isochorismatase family protein n=1 Tax=Acidisoma cellulosilyticum TaxID=2802395 RepID=A0A963Z2I7_9PROT|nr:isochorismatase family protein [Acidisoma cellulosilyticum]MCB8881421.1 isochorismatase family protein [Acidisoma cellulosilyticum]
MELSNKTARQMFAELRASPDRLAYGFGRKPMLVNVDPQNAYTSVGEFVTAYDNDPAQMNYINALASAARSKKLPVMWTYVAFRTDGSDCGAFGSRDDKPDSLQNIKRGSRRAALDSRLVIDHEQDYVVNKLMPSAFHETNLQSLLVWLGCDTVIVTGGSTSGCVRATVVDSLSRGYRTIVPEECVADLHESPHFANLYDMHKKYADVLPVRDVLAYYENWTTPMA